MSDFIEVHCPGCKTVLIVNKRDGKIVETRKPILAESTGDRFEDAKLKVRKEKDDIAKKFEAAKAKELGKMDRLNQLFKEGLERAKQEGPITKPFNPMDQD